MADAETTSESLIDSAYAWRRLVVSLAISATGGVGMWSSVVALPYTELRFFVERGEAALPYTATMVGVMAGNVVVGRLIDRYSVVVPVLFSALALLVGYVGVALAPNFWVYIVCQGLLVGLFGTAVTFGPMIAAISLWFKRRRGIAVALVASGSYAAGAIWPPFVQWLLEDLGWQAAHMIIGGACFAIMTPLAFLLRRPSPRQMDVPPSATRRTSAQAAAISPRLLQGLLLAAGIACCVAMAMPQVHIVAYCVELGLGTGRGAVALSLMLGFGVVSRVAFGAITDRIGALRTLLISSSLQALSLLLYLPAESLWTLYGVSIMFGLFQGGIVPAYAILIRDHFPASEVGMRVGLVMSSTIGGMALGGWLSGALFDLTLSYEAAFLNGFVWNLFNLAIILFLFWRIEGAISPLRPRPQT